MKKHRIIRLGQYAFRLPPPPPAPPAPISSPDACAAVEAFCNHLEKLKVQKVDLLEVCGTGIKFRSRRGRTKSDAGYVDLGLLGSRATSDNVATVFRRKHSRKDLEDMFDYVRAGDLKEAKFKASLLSAAVYLEVD
jgi:hypothetical protein